MSDDKSVAEKLQEEKLSIREHLDPDKHWIGEALAVPTQTEIAATVGTVSSPGDSPFVARADHTHKLSTTAIFQFAGIRGSNVNLADDQAAFIEFSPDGIQYGGIILTCNASGGPHAVLAFRTGDTNAFCLIIGSVGTVTLNTGAGSLNGTTGTDGNVTVRAYNQNSPTPGRVYIENRSGVVRVFTVTFIALATGIVPGTSWTLM